MYITCYIRKYTCLGAQLFKIYSTVLYKFSVSLALKRLLFFTLYLSLSVALQPNADQGRLISEVSRPHTVTHHNRYFSSGRGIGPSWRSLPSNTQQSQETDIHALAGFEPAISASEQTQTLALNHSATGIGDFSLWWYKIMYVRVYHHQ